MNLRELNETKKTTVVKRVLRETYDMHVDFDSLSLQQTRKMLSKVKNLLGEARSTGARNKQNNKAYLKLVMMEQALSDHLTNLKVYGTRIVVENEEVQKSQVILAAQDMIDTVQKMLEDVSKMNVEELIAVVDGIKNEFGSSEGDQFNQTAGQTLKTLQDALTSAREGLTQALGTITGEGSPAMPGGMGGDELPAPGGETGMPGGEMPQEQLPPPESEEPADMTGAGRGLR
jgi:cysteinyl-tRNA synthetase